MGGDSNGGILESWNDVQTCGIWEWITDLGFSTVTLGKLLLPARSRRLDWGISEGPSNTTLCVLS